ncbi:hypothetical protein IQ231_06870 [Cuspidothrix issatschenkoi LEGE 03284]|uniref:hypothetical protein n=1 Tax=Cuspidothrix issatschenkoi TaxID=230752 RepID=UPI001881C21A|nr:hypothetical protein [Cuspidothrix issatschenkoi]MBE9231417.1 hypothetical protein [Cuspidothrix issatschenkoi LEGE 03284]
MSTQTSDKRFNFSSPEKCQNTPNLTEVDPTGKIWEKHRINTDKTVESEMIDFLTHN